MNRSTLALSTLAVAAVLAMPGTGHAQGGGTINQAPPEAVTGRLPASDTGSEQYLNFNGRTVYMWNNQIVPTSGSERVVQTANSLPPGAGTATIPGVSTTNDRVVAVTSGHMAPNNGSGIQQSFNDLPPHAMEGTVPMTTSRSMAAYQARQEVRRLGYASHQNLPGVTPHG